METRRRVGKAANIVFDLEFAKPHLAGVRSPEIGCSFSHLLSIDQKLVRNWNRAGCIRGNRQLAEQLFRLAPGRSQSQSSSAVWRLSQHVETLRQREGRTSAVERVYGQNSMEMARRLEFLADNLNSSDSCDLPKVDSLFKRSQELYHRLGHHGRCAELLIERCINLVEPPPQTTLSLLGQAADELSVDPRIERSWLPDLGSYTAAKAGDIKLSHRLHMCDLKCRSLIHNDSNSGLSIWAYTMICLHVVCVALATGLGGQFMTEFRVCRAYRKLRGSLGSAQDVHARVETYSRLIDLDLHAGDFASALQNSEELMWEVDVEVNKSSAGTDYSVSQRLWRISREQLNPAVLTSLFALFWMV